MRGLIVGAIALLAASLLSLTAAQAAFKLEGWPKVAMLHLATVDDGGWSEALDRARVKTEEALGLKIAFSEKVPEDGAIVLQLVDRYVREGYNIIIGTSWGYGEALLRAARKYPHVAFLNCAGATAASNLESFYARTYQGWYLAGIVAGHLTRTEKIGAIGGYRMGPVTWDLNAFLRGAQSVNPAVEMIGVYVDTWYDPSKETQAAESLLAQGVDVLGSTLSAPGPHRAFQDRGKWSVGFQIDMSGGGAEGRRDLDGLQVGGVSDPHHPGDRQGHLGARTAGVVEGAGRRRLRPGPRRVLGAAGGGGGRRAGAG